MDLPRVSLVGGVRDYISTRKENFALFIVLLVYTIVQLVNIGRSGHMGQDWVTQRQWIEQAATHPWDWFKGSFYETNPPFYHLLVASFWVFLKPRFAFEAIGVVNCLVSLATLIVFWKALKVLVDSIWIRFTALLSVTFLPAFVIGSIVIATDAFSQLPVCVLALCFALYAVGKLHGPATLLIATLAVAFGVSIKATAIVLVPGVMLGMCVIARVLNQWTVRFFAAVTAFAALTGGLSLYWNLGRPSNALFHFNWHTGSEQKLPDPMNLESALIFRAGDRLFFNAPSAWELYRDTPPSLSISNSLSYPGLLWLGLHTDVLDVLQPHKRIFAWGLIGERTKWSKKISRLSVRVGLVTFCVAIVAVASAALYALKCYLLASDHDSAAILAILVLAGSWATTMVIIVLTVPYAYLFQYWHPRLMLPAVVLFAIPVAWLASHVLRGRQRLQIALLAGSIFQAIVHLGVIVGR